MAFFSLTNSSKETIATGVLVRTLKGTDWVDLPNTEIHVSVDGQPSPMFLSPTQGMVLQVAPPSGFEPWRAKVVFVALPSGPLNLVVQGRRFLRRFGLRLQRNSAIFGPKMLPVPSPLRLPSSEETGANSSLHRGCVFALRMLGTPPVLCGMA